MNNEKPIDKSHLTAPLSQIRPWDKNPRTIDARELERVKAQLQELGQYKPLVCFQDEDGSLVVLGGNQRLRAMGEMGWKEAWVEIREARTEEERLKLALSDNDNAGRTDPRRIQALIEEAPGIRLEAYKIQVAAPEEIRFTGGEAGSRPGQARETGQDPRSPGSRPPAAVSSVTWIASGRSGGP